MYQSRVGIKQHESQPIEHRSTGEEAPNYYNPGRRGVRGMSVVWSVVLLSQQWIANTILIL